MILVSAIMPTRGRQHLARRALESFLAQDYQFKELIVLDDADEPSFDCDEIKSAIVKYQRSEFKLTIGAKRNLCCAIAAGQIIVHFDSDDWSVTNRIAEQVGHLRETGKAVTGYYTMLFHDGKTWGIYGGAPPRHVLGTSLCYKRDFWERHPFDDRLNVGEDNEFAKAAMYYDQMAAVEGKSMMVAQIHPHNTSPKLITDFNPIEADLIPVGFSV